MYIRPEREKSVTEEESQKAHVLLAKVKELAKETGRGNNEAGIDLIYTLVPRGQDMPPEISVTYEILNALKPSEAAAIKIAHWFAGEFNRNFGGASNAGRLITRDNEHFGYFVQELGLAITGMLNSNPNSRLITFTPELGYHLGETMRAYLGLAAWAEEQLTAPKTTT